MTDLIAVQRLIAHVEKLKAAPPDERAIQDLIALSRPFLPQADLDAAYARLTLNTSALLSFITRMESQQQHNAVVRTVIPDAVKLLGASKVFSELVSSQPTRTPERKFARSPTTPIPPRIEYVCALLEMLVAPDLVELVREVLRKNLRSQPRLEDQVDYTEDSVRLQLQLAFSALADAVESHPSARWFLPHGWRQPDSSARADLRKYGTPDAARAADVVDCFESLAVEIREFRTRLGRRPAGDTPARGVPAIQKARSSREHYSAAVKAYREIMAAPGAAHGLGQAVLWDLARAHTAFANPSDTAFWRDSPPPANGERATGRADQVPDSTRPRAREAAWPDWAATGATKKKPKRLLPDLQIFDRPEADAVAWYEASRAATFDAHRWLAWCLLVAEDLSAVPDFFDSIGIAGKRALPARASDYAKKFVQIVRAGAAVMDQDVATSFRNGSIGFAQAELCLDQWRATSRAQFAPSAAATTAGASASGPLPDPSASLRAWLASARFWHGFLEPPEAPDQVRSDAAPVAPLPAAARDVQTQFVIRLGEADDEVLAEMYVRNRSDTPWRKPGETQDDAAVPLELQALLDGERRDASQMAVALGLTAWKAADVEEFAWVTRLPELVESLKRKIPGRGELEVEQRRKLHRRVISVADLDLRATAKTDWFEIDGQLRDHQVSLRDLVRATRAGKNYVQVGEEALEFSEDLAELLARLGSFAGAGTGAAVQVPELCLASLLQTVLAATSLDAWKRWTEKLRQSEQLSVPFHANHRVLELKSYQRDGYEWLVRMSHWAPGACLADEMGLGKTRQVLALLSQRDSAGPALVIAPASVCDKWAKFDRTPLRGLQALEGKQAVAPKLKPAAGDVVVVSYDLAVNNVEQLKQTDWATIVFDEGQYLKNAKAIRTIRLADLRGRFKVIVSGTPLENNLSELWAVSQFFAPGLLGDITSFRNRFADRIEAGDLQSAETLALLLRPFVYRRTMKEEHPDMPPLHERDVLIEFAEHERRHYDTRRKLADAFVRERLSGVAEANKRIHAMDLLRQLREIAGGIDMPGGPLQTATKIQHLVDLVERDRREGRHALVFSQWTRSLEKVGSTLTLRGLRWARIDGSMSAEQRRKAIDQFASRTVDVLLLTMGAGSVGIDLQAASRVYLLDPWWNPQREKQAICRAYRLGQVQPVEAVRLIVKGTVEERLREVHARKLNLFDSVMSGAAASERLTTDEILELLKAVPSS